jgi:pimeloyl-ACP methyl ester carboxylesterase
MITWKTTMNRYCFETLLKKIAPFLGRSSLLLLLLFATTVPVLLSGCDLPGAKPPVEEGAEEGEEEESEDGEGEGEEGETKKPAPPPPPPVETHLRYTLAEDYHPTRLSWTTEDGFVLQGDLYSPYGEVQALKAKAPVEAVAPAEGEEAEAGEEAEDVAEEEAPEEEASDGEGEGEEGEASATPKAPPARPLPSFRYPLVVLTHRLSSSGKRLQFLVPDLVKAGYAVLLLDVRGHGISEGLAYGGVKSWRLFTQPDWTHMSKDFKQVEHYFKHPELDLEKFPLEVIPQKMAIIAEGISANALLVRSAEKDVHLKAVVSIGARLETKKISPILSVMNSRVPILYIASQSEEMSYADTQKLFRITEAVKSLSLYPDKGAGMDILLNDAKARQTATAWIQRYMPPAYVDPAFKQALKDASASWAKQEKLNKALGKRKASRTRATTKTPDAI